MLKKLCCLILVISFVACFCGCEKTADKDFLLAMEKSITERMEVVSTENYDQADLVDIELAYIKPFAEQSFKDEALKTLCNDYLKGLEIQKDALKKEHIYEYQIVWQEGVVARYKVLASLHEKYDFMKDNQTFIGKYVLQYEEEEKLLKAYKEIEKDLESQSDAEWSFNEYSASVTLKNNTKYKYDTTFVGACYDEDNVLYENPEATVKGIKPGDSFVVTFYISDVYRMESMEASNYYDNIIFYED